MNRNTGLDFTRRGLLLGAGAMAVAGCCPAFASDIDVVVVGAGAAGIAAAQMLASLGRTCVVLEADNRIGGRALTDTRSFGAPFDIGCAWIHAAHSNPFYGMAVANNFHLHEHSLSLNQIYYRGKKADHDFVEREERAEEMIGGAIDAKADAGKDVPASAVMPLFAPPMDAAATDIGPMDAAVDLDQESVFDHAAEAKAEYDPNFLVREGFGTLVARVGKNVRAHLSTPVRSIKYDGKGVSVETNRGTVAAKAVIVTVSMGVLQKGGIAFTPGLPAATNEAIHDLRMGLLTKIPLQLTTRDGIGVSEYDNILDEAVSPKAKDDFLFLAWPWKTDLMVGFVGGSYAWELSQRPDDEVEALAKESLSRMFGSSVKDKVRKALVTPWAKNPLTLGAYSAEIPGKHGARAALREPVAERVWFAGEAAAENGLFATCGGAYLSGEKVARAVDDRLSRA
jgi:monoamine oxidase